MKIELPHRSAVAPAHGQRSLGGLRTRRLIQQLVVYALLLAGSVLFILPFMWMIATSLKQSKDVFTYPPSFLPTSFEWRNYITGWTVLPFNRFLLNTLIVTCANVVGNLISCSLVAFGFARLRARGRNLLFLLLLATLMIPREVTIVPRFLLFSQIGLVNTLWPLILPAWFGYPFFIFLLRQFFMSILHDPLIYIRSQELYTLALGLNLFRGVNFTQFNLLMAVSIIQLLPVLIIFFLAQRLFVQGVTLTGMGGR